jgi:hypothetical protein
MNIKYPPINFWEYFKSAKGAMSTAEAIFMYNACLQVPDNGVRVEMGAHKCKSALVSLMAWVKRDRHEFYLLDPEFKDLGFLNEAQSNILKFKCEYADNTGCFFETDYSTEFLPKHDGYSYIMWDSGDHGEELVQAEKRLLEDRVISDGIIVMHDVFSQFTACTRAYEQLVSTGKYEPININWQEIFDYVKEHNLEEGNNSWHIYSELPHPPNFVGVLKRIK